MSTLGIIPARYASTRFPGKPLVMIHGKSMIQRVYEQASKASALNAVFVATDDEKIYNHVNFFGGNVVMTSPFHKTGTERCCEAANLLHKKFPETDIIINIQGDEPFINPEPINNLVAAFNNSNVQIATLIKKTSNAQDLFNQNIIKVVKTIENQALYFSRSAIPFLRDEKPETWTEHHSYYKHIGIYAYRLRILKEITDLQAGMLEKAESLEQLRWLENGFLIHTVETLYESHSVDAPEDLLKFNASENI